MLDSQLVWVNLIAPRHLSNKKLRLCWWLGCGVINTSSIALHEGLTLAEDLSLPLLGVLSQQVVQLTRGCEAATG